jgi:hypothetical protein
MIKMDELTNSHGERIGKLETISGNFEREFMSFRSEVRSSLDEIQRSISKSRETNWSLIIAAAVAVGSLWAAAIRPLNKDIERQELRAAELAAMVSKSNELQFANKAEMVKLAAEVAVLTRDFGEVRENGSPITRTRLALLEHHVKELLTGNKASE